MIKKLLKYAGRYAYIGLVFFLTLAVPLSAINASERLYEKSRVAQDQADADTAQQAGLDRGAPDPGDAPDNMTPNGPCCNQPAFLQSTPLIKTTESGNSDEWIFSPVATCWDSHHAAVASRLAVSTWQVTGDLGIQFTLVGAKPSGTS
jgi:hypothetical protein